MNKEQYDVQKKRVDEYDILTRRINKLKDDLSSLNNGLLSITASYQNKIDLTYDYDFKNKIKSEICSVYEKEIEELSNKRDDI